MLVGLKIKRECMNGKYPYKKSALKLLEKILDLLLILIFNSEDISSFKNSRELYDGKISIQIIALKFLEKRSDFTIEHVIKFGRC